MWTIKPESHALVTGLLPAAKHAISFYGNAVRTAVFIRADIYGTLNFGDGDKLSSRARHPVMDTALSPPRSPPPTSASRSTGTYACSTR